MVEPISDVPLWPTPMPPEENAEMMAYLRTMNAKLEDAVAQTVIVTDQLNQVLLVLQRAEPLLKLAEGWARLRGLGRG